MKNFPAETTKRKNYEEDSVFNQKKVCFKNDAGTSADIEQKRNPTITKKIVQRIFPGPAGLLAELNTEKQSWNDYSLNISVQNVVGVLKRLLLVKLF